MHGVTLRPCFNGIYTYNYPLLYDEKNLFKFCISLSLFFFFIRPLTCVNTQCVFSGNVTKSIQLSFARSIVIFVYEINFEKKNVEELTIEEE